MFVRILIPLMILATGFGAWKWLGIPVDPPKPVHEQARQKLKTERLVLTPQNYSVVLETQGTIRAHHTTTITSLVPGIIQTVNPCFEDGAFFKEGDILAELNPADLKAELTASESRLARAEAALAQEEARAKQAKLNWDDIGYEEEPSPLVLRVPQLKEANAVVTSARADLDQATRNLERAKIRAPFDGRVKTRNVGLGQSVGGTTPLGEVFATDFAEIRLPLAPDQLPFVQLPTRENDAPVKVTLTDALGDPARLSGASWQARIVRTEGTLDEDSRELFAIARIDDPFGLVSNNPELRIGQPVRAAIQGTVLKDVFVIPRSSLRGVNRIYLIDQAESSIKRALVNPIWSNTETLVIRDGLQVGDWLATSRLPYAPDGAPIEIIEPHIAADSMQDSTAGSSSGS
jgi:RND family efflux transporter MFP subunit